MSSSPPDQPNRPRAEAGVELKVSKEDREAQTGKLYSKIGKIVVLGEHLNFAMLRCCSMILELNRLPQTYAQTALAGQNLENMRRIWESLIKLAFSDDADAVAMINDLSNRLDNIIRRRNDTVHRMWFVGWGNAETDSYEVAPSMKVVRDIGKKGLGGVKYTDRDTTDFDQIIAEVQALTDLVMRFADCILLARAGHERGKVADNFHYDENGRLLAGPRPNGT